MSLRLLVVDDIPDSADSLAVLLRLEGFEVRTAYDGRQAIETAVQFHPNVLVVDLVMPVVDGFEVARRLRAMPEFEHAHFIAFSGLAEQSHLDEASRVQFDEYVLKPPDLKVFKAILSEIAEHAER
jgi:CheY-like chemotaxis protein